MPKHFCLHCSKETQQRCSCCPSSHYCDKKCQTADWHSIHKYERHFYQLGNVEPGSKDKSSTTTQPREPDQQQKKVIEINDDRLEHARLITLITQRLAKNTRSRKDMKMTTEEREGRQKHLVLTFGDPVQKRLESRHKFLDQVEMIISEIKEMPSTVEGVAPRKLELDTEAEAELAVLFRKHDLMHLKNSYALATHKPEDVETAARYHIYVEDQSRRFIHKLVFGNDPGITFEATMLVQQEAMHKEMIKLIARDMVDKAVRDTASSVVTYLRVLEKLNGTDVPFQFTGKEGQPQPTKRKTRSAKKKENDEGQQSTTGKTKSAKENEEEQNNDQLVYDMVENIKKSDNSDTLANIKQSGQNAKATAMSLINIARDNREISDATAEYSKTIFRQVWENLWNTIGGLFQPEKSKKGKKIQHQVWESVKSVFGSIKSQLDSKTIFKLFGTLVLSSYTLLALGYASFTIPPSTQLMIVDDKLQNIIQNNNIAITMVDSISFLVEKGKDIIKQSLSMFNGTNVTNAYSFMTLDPTDKTIDNIRNAMIMRSSLLNLLGILENTIKTSVNIASSELIDEFFRNIIVLIEEIRKCDSLYECRDLVLRLKGTITKMELLMKELTPSIVETVKIYIVELENIINSLGVTADGLKETLDTLTSKLLGAQTSVLDLTAEIENRIMLTPLASWLINGISYASGLVTGIGVVVVVPILAWAAYTIFGIRMASALCFFKEAERQLHHVLKINGVFDGKGGFETLLSIGKCLYNVSDLASILMTTIAGLWMFGSVVYSVAGMVVSEKRIKDVSRKLINYVYEMTTNGSDYDALSSSVMYSLQEIADGILEDYEHNEKKVLEWAADELSKGNYTPQQYYILLRYIMKKEIDANGNTIVTKGGVFVDEFTLRIDTIAYFSKIIAYVHVMYINDFIINILSALYYLLSFFSTPWGIVSGAIAYLIIGVILFLRNTRNANQQNEQMTPAKVVGHVLAPFSYLVQQGFAVKYDYLLWLMFVVQIISLSVNFGAGLFNIISKPQQMLESLVPAITAENELVKKAEEIINGQTSGFLDTIKLPVQKMSNSLMENLFNMSMFVRGSDEAFKNLSREAIFTNELLKKI